MKQRHRQARHRAHPSAGVTHLDSKSIRLVGAEPAFTRDEVPAEFE
jgi:hypothetical protein